MRRYAHFSARGLTLLCTTLPGLAFAAAPFGSPGWMAQNNVGRPPTGASAGAPGVPSALSPGGVTSPDQALRQASRSMADLSRAAAAITAAQTAQTAARQFALTQPNPAGVADGLAPGGLMFDQARAVGELNDAASCSARGTCTWVGIDTGPDKMHPVVDHVDAASGHHQVEIQQTAQHALLTWDSFNIGRDTTVHFDQRAGTQGDGSNDWVALNRVTGNTAPSRILGGLQAEGSVYVINAGGIIFGGSSQVNVHTLVATSLSPGSAVGPSIGDIESNAFFLSTGVLSTDAKLKLPQDADGNVLATVGDVRIEAGAAIQVQPNGIALFAAPNVDNAGQIVADDGEAILAGGSGMTINAGNASVAISVQAGVLGLDNVTALNPGTVTNTGLIQARRGTVQLAASDVTLGTATVPGTSITQASTIVTTTSVTRPGGITINADTVSSVDSLKGYNGVVRMDPATVLALLPDADGSTTTSSALADSAFTRGAITIRGSAVRMMGDALIESPGQNVSVTAVAQGPIVATMLAAPLDGSVAGRVFLDAGATIDVAGIANIELPVSVNFVSVPRLGQNELADSPLQRSGILFGAAVVVDRRRRGLRSDGTTWFGTPIANVNGYVDLVPRTVDQLLRNAGNISLAGNEVLTQTGSFLDLDAGYLHYLGGEVPVTRLLTATGTVVDIANADPLQTYVGFAGQSSVDHARWNVTDVFGNPVLASSSFETDYIESGAAGALTITLSGGYAGDFHPVGLTQILDGSISAHATAGRYQVANGTIPAGGAFSIGSGGDISTAVTGGALSYVIRDGVPQLDDLAAAFDFASALPVPDTAVHDPWNHPELPVYWSTVSGNALSDAGFSAIKLVTGGEIRVEDSGLHVQPGGSIDLRASIVTIGADLVAPAGRVAVTSFGQTANPTLFGTSQQVGQSIFVPSNDAPGAALPGNIEVLPGVTISARGQWVNDTGLDADHITGAAHVNGGSVSLVAWAASGQQLLSGLRGGLGSHPVYETPLRDLSGSVLLDEGSVVDVGSGGRLLPSGLPNQSDLVFQGRGGSVALETYFRLHLLTVGGTTFVPPTEDLPGHATIGWNGTVRAFGFSGGGTLTLEGDRIAVGADAESAPEGTLLLAPEFFASQGFGNYVLDAIGHEGLVAAGVTLQPLELNLLPDVGALLAASTDADILADGRTTVGALDTFHRQPASLSFLAWQTVSVLDGAGVRTDPGASVLLGGREGTVVEGGIVAPGGRITLTADVQASGGYSLLPDISNGGIPAFATSVWLGPESVLDVSGLVVRNEAQQPVIEAGHTVLPQTGRVVAGGTVTLTDDNGYVIALSCADVGGCADPAATGARIVFSGAEGVLDLRDPFTGLYTARDLWSDAGALRIGANVGLFFDGTIEGHAGGQGRGGTLSILPITEVVSGPATALILTNAPPSLPQGAIDPGAKITPSSRGALTFAGDRLAGSGLDDVFLGWDPGHLLNTAVRVTLGQDLHLAAGRSIDIDAAFFGADPTTPGASAVRLAAPYVDLHGYNLSGNVPPQTIVDPALTFEVDAQAIDLGGRVLFRDFGDVRFVATGDIRLQPDLGQTNARRGMVYLAGNLTFSAAQIYPESNTPFAVVAGGPEGRVTFLGNEHSAGASMPLSVGGELDVDAAHIVQSGVLRAPAGHIVLGVGNPDDAVDAAPFGYIGSTGIVPRILPVVATQDVTLAPDAAAGNISLTSVSLDGATLPDGHTVDGTDWTVDGLLIGAPPDQQVFFRGAGLDLALGARVDLSGGGSVVAQEWIPGTGGSHDVLSQYNEDLSSGTTAFKPLYQDARGVYAIVPGYSSQLGAFDFDLLPYSTDTSISPTVDPMVGRSVYLSGIPGLPAGVYTLLPGQYATLPGAFRVVQDTRATNAGTDVNMTLPDGTQYVAGHFVDAFTGAHAALETAFYVQAPGVWRQYSEYLLSDADTYFAGQADRKGTALPTLLRDAGQLVLAATRSIDLGATLDTAPAAGGIGARIDIAAPQLEVTGSGGGTPLEGYVQIDANALDALGASSLLLGGTRTRTADGDVVTAVSTQLVVDNGTEVLQAPEIVLVGRGASREEGVFVRGSVLDADGNLVSHAATIAAAGTIDAAADVPLLLGHVPDPDTGLGGVSGDGALLRVSNGAPVLVLRTNVTGLGDGPAGLAGGTLQIGAGASVTADRSIVLDSTGATTLAPTVTFGADVIEADSNRITLVAAGAAAPPDAVGLVLSPDQLALLSQASDVTLRSRGEMDFVGDYALTVTGGLTLGAGLYSGDGGAVQLNADRIAFENPIGALNVGADVGTGSLQVSAREVAFGPGDMALSGFGAVDVEASGPAPGAATTTADGARIVMEGIGSFDFGTSSVVLHTPLLAADAGANGTLRADGLLQVIGGSGTASTAAPLGGTLHLDASALQVDTALQALGGTIDLVARSGDLAVGAGARISAQGAARTFFDVERYASGGTIRMTAQAGNVEVAAGAALDVSAPTGGGDAGTIDVSAQEDPSKPVGSSGNVNLQGTLLGSAAAGEGGHLALDTSAAVDLDRLASTLAGSGLDGGLSVRTRTGNLLLSSGNTIAAGSVELVADGGALPSTTDGNVIVHGTIDTSGDAGGAITLYGRSGVDLDGTLDAHSTLAGQRGGTVTLGTRGSGDGTYDARDGYENVTAAMSGTLHLHDAARIDVRGDDPANGLEGGVVHLRAPLLQGGAVNVIVDPGARTGIAGARDVTLEAYAVWSTADDAGVTGADHHFDGIIDPAGLFDAAGAALGAGRNADHRAYYGGTLAAFVRDPGIAFGDAFDGIANFHARPGIDLVNADPAVNGGDIRVVSNWNLGAGTMNADRSLDLLYRYQGNAPVLTLRAAGDAIFDASLSDGFFQYNNPYSVANRAPPAPLDSDNANGVSPEVSTVTPLPLLAMGLAAQASVGGVVSATYDSSSYRIVAGASSDSADPGAVSASAGGDVIVDGHVSAAIFNPFARGPSRTMTAPTMIRTGIGSIDIEAAGDVKIVDAVAPGVIYTAGRPAADAPTGVFAAVVYSSTDALGTRGHPWLVDTGESHPVGAGDLTLAAGGEIDGFRGVEDDADGTRTGNRSAPSLDQYWWPWMQGLCATLDSAGTGSCGTDTSPVSYGIVNFGAFDQGVLSAGGNVRVRAGGRIVDLSVSLPTSFVLNADGTAIDVLGGGNLSVAAGSDILGGDFFVSAGEARIVSGGRIGAGGRIGDDGAVVAIDGHPVPTVIAMQDARFTVRAQQGAEIGDVIDPSYLNPSAFDERPYGVGSSLTVDSTSGDVTFDARPAIYNWGVVDSLIAPASIWPAQLSATALTGGLQLNFPNPANIGLTASPDGNLSLVANDTVEIDCGGCRGGLFGLFDVDADAMRNSFNTIGLTAFTNGTQSQSFRDHSPMLPHAGDAQPVRIYSLAGDLDFTNDGVLFTLVPNKPAFLRAGRDIADLSFVGQNLRDSDVSVIGASRDIFWNPTSFSGALSLVQIGGPGTFEVSAGRDLGPLLPSIESAGGQIAGNGASGILSVGNQYNPFLGRGNGADLLVEFGVAPGVAVAAFANAYIAPQRTVGDVPSYTGVLIDFVQKIRIDEAAREGLPAPAAPTADEAWTAYLALPEAQQKVLAYAVLYDILDTVGLDHNRASSPFFQQYGRGYAALDALFPSSLGYSANHLDGSVNGADAPVTTGTFDMRNASVQTQQGGDISIVGPGGSVLVGSASAPPFRINEATGKVTVGPNKLGIIALQTGSVRTFTDQDVLLAQSRIFTQQGGDVVMWSSNGDINAGKGAKTTTELPTASFLCDGRDHFCVLDATTQVSGAGIGALQTLPGEPGGNVNLVAPAGTVDAGDAGIRVSGNLNIAAAVVANANNIQVSGSASGVPTGNVDTGALGAASAAAAAAAQAATDVAASATSAQDVGSLVKGEVLGYGSMTEEQKRKLR